MSESNKDETKEQTKEQDTYEEVLSKITNPSGEQKYKDPLTALQSIKPKEDHIQSLEEQVLESNLRLKELEDELSKRDTTEELVNKVMENRQEAGHTDKLSEGVAEKIDIGELVRQELAGITAEQTKVSNRESVASTLVSEYGDKANEVLTNKMAELNVHPEFFASVIEQSPAAALELLGLRAKTKTAPVKPQGSVRAEQFSETAPAAPVSVMTASNKAIAAQWDKMMAEALAS